jgi:parallel beta-helix repeat protein
MKALPIIIVSAVLLFPLSVGAVTLQQAYDDALPGAGYDRMIFLDPAESYTGGIHLQNETVCILSYGAQVDLQGDRIIVDPDAVLDISGVVLTYSDSAALKYDGAGDGWVDHCTFYGNYDGLYFWDNSDMTITSNIFSNSSHWGVYTHEDAQRWMAYNDAWENASGDYKEWCPG